MAAKPPKPPGNFLKELNDCLSNNSLNNNNNNKKQTKNPNKSVVSCSNTIKKEQILYGSNPNISANDKSLEEVDNENNNATTSVTKSDCKCTNISIMHLFHEMKQEFPTIPDTIVAQCVNENCHQRENCIQQLRNELASNPIPAQAYPAKVLHPNQRQHLTAISPKSPKSPLKPIRPAPLQPTNAELQLDASANGSKKKFHCDSIRPATNTILNKHNNHNNNYNNNNNDVIECIDEEDVENNIGESATTSTIYTPKPSDMPVVTNPLSADSDCDYNYEGVSKTRLNSHADNRENLNPNDVPLSLPSPLSIPSPVSIVPRTRPTTLDLQTQFQQKQRQQLNIQLQKHFQQQQQKHEKQPQIAKPLRKAPLPPIPPKPVQLINSGAQSPLFHQTIINNNSHQNTNINNNYNHINNLIGNNCGLIQSQQSSSSNDSSLTSPTNSVGESEISVNVSLSSPSVAYQPTPTPTPTPPGTTASSISTPSLKSPIRHRSVITVQPEPPYTKDFVTSPTNGSQPGQKSYTSVNLTLRQPNTNSSIPASTIDISAGPGLNGNSSGLTYSSTSYDARRGFQKNFHITVTDQGGVFSASHIRPRSCFYPGGEYDVDGPTSSTTANNCGNYINPLRTASSEQCVSQQLPLIVASNEMCLPKGISVLTETLERQKNRRDNLATALRDNRKKFSEVEHEINVIIEAIDPSESIRLDDEIKNLRDTCEAMLNEIDVARRSASCLPNVINENVNNIQQQTQSFPRQRHRHRSSSSTTSPLQPHPQLQPQLDFIQHHSNQSITNLAMLPANNTTISNQQVTRTTTTTPPPTFQEYYQQYRAQQNMPSTDEEYYTDSPTDDDEGPLQTWECNMCTFHNHPQLNICECCENVRIPSRTFRIVSAATANANASAAAAATSTPTPTPTNNNNNNVMLAQ